MKTLIKTIMLLFALSPLLLLAQSPDRKLMATLGPGETIASGESYFMLDKNPESVSFVTAVGSGSSKEYYCYGKDGKKTGPVKQPDPSYWAEGKDIKTDDCIPNNDPKTGDPAKYVDWTTGSVSFQGKQYGPYGQVLMFYLSDDEQSFYAVGLTGDMKIYFFDKTGRKIELTNLPEEVIISPDGSRAYAKIKGTINPFDPDAAQKMMDHPEEMNNPPVSLIGIDGKNFGPYTTDSFSDAWFAPAGQLIVYNAHEVSVEGKKLFKSDDYISPCDIWISQSGASYAWADYEFLHFSDGSKYTAPIAITNVDGQLKWLSLENGKELVLYKKVF